MAFDKAKAFLEEKGYADRIKVFDDTSSATVALAALALGTTEGRIAKSLTFKVDDKPIMIVAAGDVKIDNAKYRHYFGSKAKMLTYDEVKSLIGHAVGGVCPFGINEGVKIFLDKSLYKYEVTHPACGSDNSAVRLTADELGDMLPEAIWVDVCKDME